MPTTTIAAIERQLDFRASPERVWRALTDERELAAWFGHRASLDLRVGGEGWFEWEGHGRFPVRIEVLEPPRLLAWRWGQVGGTAGGGGSTLVELRLEPLGGGGTRLFLRESGFGSEASRWDNTEGWLTELAELAAHVAAEPWEAGIHRVEHLASSPERVWHALGEADGLAAWWSGKDPMEVRAGAEGWWRWEVGNFAYRVEAVEPPRYLCWTWAATADTPLEAAEVLRTEWVLVPREDGGTDLHLLETGFHRAASANENEGGWTEMLGELRRTLGEAAA
jgi:uncharacterized protein YndB with AHSA1/START domain